MKLWPEVHWSEGQFMRPHHLQTAFRNAETLRNAAIDGIQPFAWGFTHLDLAADAIEKTAATSHGISEVLAKIESVYKKGLSRRKE